MEKRSTLVTTVGLDVGDRNSRFCVLAAADGERLEEGRVATSEMALRQLFGGREPMRIALEAGTHSGWISRLLAGLGHEVIVANPRKVRLIYENRQKDDRIDAEQLARLARLDPRLLRPITHRSAQAEADHSLVRSRAILVQTRAALINHCRGLVKTAGGRLPSSDARSFAAKAATAVPAGLGEALEPVLASIAELTEHIRRMDRKIEELAKTRYPETALLRQVHGVGALSALSYVLKLQSPKRFATSRQVGAYLGLVPARADSGASRPQLRITKEGDSYLRKLLVQCAHYILGPFGIDCDLRRYGERLVRRGGKAAKKRAAVAVARKLAVLLHHLWRSGEAYEPLRNVLGGQRAA